MTTLELDQRPTGVSFRLWDGPTPAFLNDLEAHDVGRTIDERFDAFHVANPWIYRALVQLALEWKSAGHERCGIKMMVEVLRWQWGRAAGHDVDFRVNNDFTSRYARMISERNPELAGMFWVRTLRSRNA